MEIQSTDKLLIGRDGQSFQTSFEDSGIATVGNLDGYLKQSGDTVNTGSEVVYNFQNGIKFYNWGTDFSVTHRYVKIETDSHLDLIANDDLTLQTIDGGDIYLKPSGSINVNNNLIRSVRTPYIDGDAANKGYVDSKFDSVDLSNTIPLSGTVAGQPVTGNIDLSSNTNINIVGNGAGLNIESGYWGGLFYNSSLQFEFGMNGIKFGTDINMKAGQIGFNDSESERQYNNVGGGVNSILHGHGIHWLKAPEHKYDAVNKEHVDNNFLGLNFNNLPVLS
jgi:hypothetical protein